MREQEFIMCRFISISRVIVLTGLVLLAARPGSPLPARARPPVGDAMMDSLLTQDLSLEQAQAILAAAAERGTKMDVAVVDAGGNLKAFARMDGAWLGSIDIAVTKARTARYFDLPTEELGKLSQPGGPLYQIEASNGGLITFPGGLPLKAVDGTVIGAVGVSGSTVEDDRAVAEAGAAALAGPGAGLPETFDQSSGTGGRLAGGMERTDSGEENPT